VNVLSIWECLCVPLPGKATSLAECVSAYWNQSVILAVTITHSIVLDFLNVTRVPVNYSELEANSMKFDFFGWVLQPFKFLSQIHEDFLSLFYHCWEWYSVTFPSSSFLSSLSVRSHIPFDCPVVSCFWLARPAKVFLALSSWTPRILVRVEFILLQAKCVALTNPVNPTCIWEMEGTYTM